MTPTLVGTLYVKYRVLCNPTQRMPHAVINLPEAGETPSFPHYWAYGWGNRHTGNKKKQREEADAKNTQLGDYPDILHWVKTPAVNFTICDTHPRNLTDIGYQPGWVICAGRVGFFLLDYY